MDIRMPAKSTTSVSSIGDKTSGEKASNFTYSPRAVEATIGDNSQGGSARKSSVSVEKTVDVNKSESTSNDLKLEDLVDVQDTGCGDVQIELAEVNIGKKELCLEDILLVSAKESSSDSEQDELIATEDELIATEDDLDDNQITTWTWQEVTQGDDGKKIKRVDVLYDDIDSDVQAEEELTGNENVIYRSTPVTEILNEDNKDYSDISSEVLEGDFDGSSEACFHRVHHPSLLSTSVEENEDDYEEDVEDDDINSSYQSHHYKSANTSDDVDERNRREDNYFDDTVDDDVNDPELKLWLRRKLQPNSTDNSAQSDSLDEELACLGRREPQTVIMADKSVQVCEEDIQSSDRNGPDFSSLTNWLKGIPSLEVISQVSRPTQTVKSFLRRDLGFSSEFDTSEGDGQRLSAGDDGGIAGRSVSGEALASGTPIEESNMADPKIEEESEDDEKQEVVTHNGVESSEDSDASMPEHLHKLLNSLHEIPPVPSEDGSCNMWMVPAQDENGNCMNVVLDNGEMYDIFIFRPSCPMTTTSTQTIEEEFDAYGSGLPESLLILPPRDEMRDN